MRGRVEKTDQLSREERNELMDKVNKNFQLLEEVENDLVEEYVQDLDEIIYNVRTILIKRDGNITNEELSEIILQLPTVLYFVADGVEKLAMKETIMTIIKKEVFNKITLEAAGKSTDKKALAELNTQKEQLMQTIYSSASKLVKVKLEVGYELLNSVKKILSERIASNTYEGRNR